MLWPSNGEEHSAELRLLTNDSLLRGGEYDDKNGFFNSGFGCGLLIERQLGRCRAGRHADQRRHRSGDRWLSNARSGRAAIDGLAA